VPHNRGKARFRGQELGHPAQNPRLVAQKEKDQQRHQDKVNQKRDKASHRGDGVGEHLLAKKGHLGGDDGKQAFYLCLGNNVGVSFGQGEKLLLALSHHFWQILDELAHLGGERRHKNDKHRKHNGHKGDKDKHHPQGSGNFQKAQAVHHSVKQVGYDYGNGNRSEHVAKPQDEEKPAHKDKPQDDDLGVGQVAAHPLAEHVGRVPAWGDRVDDGHFSGRVFFCFVHGKKALPGRKWQIPPVPNNALAGIFARNIKPEPNFNKNSTGIREVQGLCREWG
jgi:hypothetical protein